MPAVRVLRHEAQRSALPDTGDQERDPAQGRWVQPVEPVEDHRDRRLQRAEPRAAGPEVIAVLAVVALGPARADAVDHPAAADVVDRPHDVGEELWVAVRVAGHERADLDTGGGLGERGEHRPALEVRAVPVAVEREEVVPRVDDVVADPLRADGGGAQIGPRTVLRMELGGDADRMLHGTSGDA